MYASVDVLSFACALALFCPLFYKPCALLEAKDKFPFYSILFYSIWIILYCFHVVGTDFHPFTLKSSKDKTQFWINIIVSASDRSQDESNSRSVDVFSLFFFSYILMIRHRPIGQCGLWGSSIRSSTVDGKFMKQTDKNKCTVHLAMFSLF